MPVYNGETFLREAIQSIVNQSYPDWELIIINDGSIDGSENIILSFTDERIKYYKNDKNLGLIDTLNLGIGYCNGKYVARMDADDISNPNRLSIQLAYMEKHQDYAMCGSNAIVINDKNERIGKIVNLASNEYLQVNLLFSVPFVHPSMMIRKETLAKFKYDNQYKHAEDYDLWCRVAQKNQIANISEFLLEYRWHSTNISVIESKNQEKTKNSIIVQQLASILGIKANDDDLYLHKVTFNQKNSKEQENRISEIFSRYSDLNNWFSMIIDANNSKKIYIQNALIAYLWSRWIVLCIFQKKYAYVANPTFVKYTPNIIFRTLKLIYQLSKK